MLGALDSVRWERLSRGLTAMAQQGPSRRSLSARLPAEIGMPDLLTARHDAVVKAAKRAKRSRVVTDFHRLRIRCKRLRYALEFSSEVYGGRTSRFVRQLTALQDELGLMQDAEVASIQLADLAIGEAHLPRATVFVMGGIAERHRREVDKLLRGLHKEVSRVDGREWRELRALFERRRSQAAASAPQVRPALRAVPRPDPDVETGVPEEPDPGPQQSAHPGQPGQPGQPDAAVPSELAPPQAQPQREAQTQAQAAPGPPGPRETGGGSGAGPGRNLTAVAPPALGCE